MVMHDSSEEATGERDGAARRRVFVAVGGAGVQLLRSCWGKGERSYAVGVTVMVMQISLELLGKGRAQWQQVLEGGCRGEAEEYRCAQWIRVRVRVRSLC